MAFGFSPKYSQDFPTEGISPKRSFVLALEATKKLGWDIGYLNETGFIAYTKFSMSSWSEEVQFKIDFHTIEIKSECTGSQLIDWGKNKKNVERFIKTYESIKDQYTKEELDSKYDGLEQSFPDKNQVDQPLLSRKQKITGVLSIFQAREGYTVTPSLLGLNILIFIFMIILGVDFFLPDVESLILWGANYSPETLDNQWWRLLTSCFIHIGIIHLLMNMYALVYIGLLLEPYLGKVRFFSAYVLTGIVGSVSSLYWNELTVSAGSSGAIFGMYGVFIAMLTTNLIEKSARKAILTSIVVFVGYNLMAGLQHDGVDNAAHLGGLISGIIIGYLFYPSLVRSKSGLLKTATIFLLVILVSYPTFLILTTTPNDILIYERKIEQFTSMEKKALEIFNLPDEMSDEQILRQIEENGISIWEESISLLRGADTLDIPDQLQDRNQKLIEYSQLRIKSYETIYKSISENSMEYQTQIDSLNIEIEKKIDELSR